MEDTRESLAELVRLVCEKRIREADISDGQKAKWGSRKHISDLKRRLKEAEYWRDKQKKGSEKRAHYRNVVNDIKRQLSAATRRTEIEESIDTIGEMTYLITEKVQQSPKNDYSDPERKRDGIKMGTVSWPSIEGLPEFDTGNSDRIGRGEVRLAWLMNGHVMGQNDPYDVVGSTDGRYFPPSSRPDKWEVKEPDKSGVIRLGGPSSAKGVSDIYFEILRATRMIKSAYKNSGLLKDSKIVTSFIEEHSTEISKGNLTQGRYNALLVCINGIKQILNSSIAQKNPKEYPVKIGSAEIFVPHNVYMRLGVLAGIKQDVLQMTPADHLEQDLDHVAFTDTHRFIAETDIWKSEDLLSSIIRDAMEGLTGVILVNAQSYEAIPTANMASRFYFEGLAAGRIKLRVIN